MLTPRCLGTSHYVCPGNDYAPCSNMHAESVSHHFPFFPDPIFLDTGAAVAPSRSFSCSHFLRNGPQNLHVDMQLSTESY